jgi:hypothetical protein
MTINQDIDRLNAEIDRLHAIEARIKATRMSLVALRDDRIRDRQVLLDHVFEDVLDQPGPDDITEHDFMRFDGITAAEAFLDHVSQIHFDIEQGAEL